MRTVLLERPLHADRRHTECPLHLDKLALPFVAQRTREHAERCQIIGCMGEDRHVVVEIPDHTVSFDDGEPFAQHVAFGGEDRQPELTASGRGRWSRWRRHARMVSFSDPVHPTVGGRLKLCDQLL